MSTSTTASSGCTPSSKKKNDEICKLKEKLMSNEEVRVLKRQLVEKNAELASLHAEDERQSLKLQQMRANCQLLEEKLKAAGEDNSKLQKELDNNEVLIESVTGEIASLKEKLTKKGKVFRELEDAIQTRKQSVTRLEKEASLQKVELMDREAEIATFNENAERYQNGICLLEDEIKELKKADVYQLTEKIKRQNVQINDLRKERVHMMELLNEKEKIINKMAEDSHKLHVNLMTMKSKLEDPGNIINLGNKLKEEKKRSTEMVQEIHDLKVRLGRHENNNMVSSVDEITEQRANQIDSKIMTAVSDQSLDLMSDVEVYKKFLNFEKISNRFLSSRNSDLETELAMLRSQLRERDVLVQTQTDEAKLIEQLAIQLDAVLGREKNLRRMLNEKVSQEIDSLRRKHVTSSESTEYRQLPFKEMLELSLLRRDFKDLQREKNSLSDELEALKRSKSKIDVAFKYTEELLGSQVQKVKVSEEKYQRLLFNEKQLMENLRQKELMTESLKDELDRERANFSKQMEIIQKLTNEKGLVENELAALKGSAKNNLPFTDFVARSDFLFYKTLKLQSVKKALVWQKRYLMEHLQRHHQHCLNQALPTAFSNRGEFRRHHPGKQRFRSASFAIISIIRMKLLVRRWHSGVRIAEKVNARHYATPGEGIQEPIVSPRFYEGHPVSDQLSANVPAGNVGNQFKFFRHDCGDGGFDNVENPGSRISGAEKA